MFRISSNFLTDYDNNNIRLFVFDKPQPTQKFRWQNAMEKVNNIKLPV